ncbi:GcrA family cell cycle regulator [Mesorhizobium australicum]|uniref:GcrA family cell cycle regulator n=1 Tax=Mesorhizobium australicum TaxID=536018 RepID=UPI000A023933
MPENIRLMSRDVPLIQLGVYQCRFPVSEDPSVPGGYRFCAGPTSPDRVYCDHHHSIVTAVDPRRARSGLHLPQRRAA